MGCKTEQLHESGTALTTQNAAEVKAQLLVLATRMLGHALTFSQASFCREMDCWVLEEIGEWMVKKFFLVHTEDGWLKLNTLCVMLLRCELQFPTQDSGCNPWMMMPESTRTARLLAMDA